MTKKIYVLNCPKCVTRRSETKNAYLISAVSALFLVFFASPCATPVKNVKRKIERREIEHQDKR
jgi:hypothetical protein